MKCSNCGFENKSDKKFCIKCGTSLIAKCPQCGKEVEAEAAFCGECGQDLQTASDKPVDYTQPESYTPRFLADKILTTRGSIEGERKLVTVFFADVAAYTTLSEKLDPEEVHQIMDGAFKILMDEIHRFEGTINQFTGDGVMALFGAPLAHEDHAQRACHAALSVQKSLNDYGDKIKSDTGLEFKMRIGLNSGHVIVGSIGDDLRMDYTAVGDTTNLADRMQGLSDPGSVMVSANTFRLASNYFEFESLGKVEVKGKEEKQEAYRLIKAGEIDTRIGASVSKGLTRFVGRKISMAALQEPFDRVLEGSGQVTGVVGEAGVGKSRLLLEFISQLLDGEFTYLEGRCLHYGGSMAYLPIIDILKSYFEVKDGDREYLIKKKIEEKIQDLDLNLEQTLPSFQEILSLKVDDESYLKQDAQMKKILTFEALRDLFVRISQIQPLIIAIEDLHWIDKISEDFIDYLIGWLANSKIHLLLLYRPEYTHQWGSKSYYSKIGLDQLHLDYAKELVKAMLKGGKVAPELRELILSRSAGNPLFMEEFTQTLIENGSIKKEQDRFVLDIDAKDIQVPDTIQGIISARMDRLEDNLKRTMQVASVIGRDFAFRILQSITGMKEELKSYLLNLQGLEFIYEKKLFPELEYIFKHALIQEVAYNSLLQTRRKEIHQKIAEAIEQLYSDRIEEFYEILAYHSIEGDFSEKAIFYLQLSADKASKIYAFTEVVQLLKQALEIQEEVDFSDKTKRCELVLALSSALIKSGRPRLALDNEIPKAWKLAQAMKNEDLLVRICITAFQALNFYGSGAAMGSPEAIKWAKLSKPFSGNSTIDKTIISSHIGVIKSITGNEQKGIIQLEASLESAKLFGTIEQIWSVANNWLTLVTSPQHFQKRQNIAAEMIASSQSRVDVLQLSFSHIFLVDTFLSAGQRKQTEEVIREAIKLLGRSGLQHQLLHSKAFDALLACLDGRLTEVQEIIESIGKGNDDQDFDQYIRAVQTAFGIRSLLYLGKANHVPPRAMQGAKDPLQNLFLAFIGQNDHTIKYLDEVYEERLNIDPLLDERWYFRDILDLESAVLVGHRYMAERVLKRFSGSGIKTTGVYQTTCIPRHLGAAAKMLERYQEARKHCHEAIKVCTEMPFRPELALSRFQLAELQFEHFPEERTEALEHLDFAISEFDEMKMKPSLEKALGLRQSLGAI